MSVGQIDAYAGDEPKVLWFAPKPIRQGHAQCGAHTKSLFIIIGMYLC